MRIQGAETRYVATTDSVKITKSFEELKANTPKQDDGVKMSISKEGIERFRNSIMETSKKELGNTGVMLTDYRSMISSKLPSTYGEQKENGEYERIYQSVSDKADSLLKAYAESYDEIQKGYADGTREAYVADDTSETGYRKLTKEEELAELDKAYKQHTTEFEHNNNSKIISALAENAKKIKEATGGRAKIATATVEDLEKRKAEVDKLPSDMGKKLQDAAMSFKVQYGLSQTGKIDISNMLKGISVFGTK